MAILEQSIGSGQTKVSVDIRENTGGVLPQSARSDLFLQSFASSEIDELRWNKAYPYQLAVLRAQKGGGYRLEPGWLFTLPIPPEEMTIQTPFAISTSITLGGVVEQHNGIPIHMISFSGTTGVYPLRGSGDGLKEANLAEAIFAGTITSARSVTTNLSGISTGAGPISPNLYDDRLADDAIIPRGTGYYQFRLLQAFLETYAVSMKDPLNRDLRLALLVWKNQAAYLVSPLNFMVKRSKDSPHEFRYDLQLKAWGRIDPDVLGVNAPAVSTSPGSNTRSPNLLAQVLTRIDFARKTLQAARDTIKAVNADFDATVGETLRETALMIKDTIGVSQAAADMPKSIVQGMKQTILTQFENIKNSIDSTDPKVQSQVTSISSLSSAQKSKLQTDADLSDPAYRILNSPEDFYPLFSSIRISNLNVPGSVRTQMSVERNRVRQFTRGDFEAKRDALVLFAADYADRVGAGSSTYNTTYGRNITTMIRTPTDQDYSVLGAMNEAIIQLSKMAAYTDINPNQGFVTAIEAMASLSARSGISFQTPVSKFAVPVPYGFTIEQIAQRYLQDPNRWNEIAALNDLREPFIDETGFELTLLTNASGTTVTVQDVSNLLIGQPVTIFAPAVGTSVRKIVAITRMSASYYAVKLDGTASLASYTTGSGAKLHSFRPGTVNSQGIVYIPSTKTSTNDPKVKAVPGVNDLDHMLNVGGIDLLLTSSGDIAATPDGDCRLAFGLTNLVQTVRIALETPRGSLLLHPNFGLDVQPGISTADFTARDLLASVRNMFRDDPSFLGVQSASVLKQGTATSLVLGIGVVGYDQNIPITVDVR